MKPVLSAAVHATYVWSRLHIEPKHEGFFVSKSTFLLPSLFPKVLEEFSHLRLELFTAARCRFKQQQNAKLLP